MHWARAVAIDGLEAVEERVTLTSGDGGGQDGPDAKHGLATAKRRRQPPPPIPGVHTGWSPEGGGARPPRRLPPPVPSGFGGDVALGETAGGPWPPPASFERSIGDSSVGGGDWRAAPAGPGWPPAPRRGGVGLLVSALVLAVTAATVGAGVGAAIAHRGDNSSAQSGFALLPPIAPRATASAADSAIAANVDPAVVDVNTTLGLENGAAAGTGMIITSAGEVLTNNHVVDGATKVSIQIDGRGPTYSAKVLGTDATDDVAVLQIQGAGGLKTVKLGDSSKVAIGDRVVATGNALGLQGPPSVVGGSVTALDQSITASDAGGGNAEQLSGLVETDAPLRPGDSGGPLVNTSAEVIGMDTAAAGGGRSRSSASVAFAIPINAAMTVVHQIEAGRASATVHIGDAALLGVEVQAAGAPGASTPTIPGAVVAGVTPNTPAESLGLAVGDRIVSVDGKAVDTASALTERIGDYHPGDSAKIGWVDKAGKSHSATVQLTTGPAK